MHTEGQAYLVTSESNTPRLASWLSYLPGQLLKFSKYLSFFNCKMGKKVSTTKDWKGYVGSLYTELTHSNCSKTVAIIMLTSPLCKGTMRWFLIFWSLQTIIIIPNVCWFRVYKSFLKTHTFNKNSICKLLKFLKKERYS